MSRWEGQEQSRWVGLGEQVGGARVSRWEDMCSLYWLSD